MYVRFISCKLERPGSTWGTGEAQRWWRALAIRAPGHKTWNNPEDTLHFGTIRMGWICRIYENAQYELKFEIHNFIRQCVGMPVENVNAE